MGVSKSDLERIAQTLDGLGAHSESPLAGLREQFPAVKFVRLDAPDIEGRPVHSAMQFDLYLLDTRDHCPVLTADLSIAGAVVVTPRKERHR
jgi:hypothetical protein